MSNLIGRFYLKLTDSKNLIGEFSNNHKNCRRNYTEGADRISPNADDGKFDGEYITTWHEENRGRHECVLARLKIKQKTGCENIFSLTWWNFDGRTDDDISFRGEGILCDGILIGDYRNFDDCNSLPAS